MTMRLFANGRRPRSSRWRRGPITVRRATPRRSSASRPSNAGSPGGNVRNRVATSPERQRRVFGIHFHPSLALGGWPGMKAYIALGSNLGDRGAWLEKGLRALREHPSIAVLRVSSFLETEPVGGPPA